MREQVQAGPHSETPSAPGMSRGMMFLFAFAGAVAVGNLYWAQPLLAVIARDFGLSLGTAGFLVTGTQIGYALGILLCVPLGDIVNRRILLPAAMITAALALLSAAFAPSFAALTLSLAAVGVLTTGGQMLPPLAGDLATPEQRGTVVGTIASGMLTGILMSRSISGLLADAFGWQFVFGMAAVATGTMAILLWRLVPDDRVRAPVSYRKLIGSIFRAVRKHAVMRATLIIGACSFAVFSIFWTGLTFLLSGAPYNYSLSQIGLVGLAGLAGAIAAKNAGRLYDRGFSTQAQGVALLVTFGCLIAAIFAATSIAVLIVVIVVFDAAVQSINVLNQVRVLTIEPQARSRMNSAFVTSNFIGGAIGSALAGAIWPLAGWTGLMLTSAGLILIAGAVWLRWSVTFAQLAARSGK
jgi:predicted MFS family arabinose efflux permease